MADINIHSMREANGDIIYLRDLRIEATIGLYAWERCVKQLLIIDLDMATDIRCAAASDSIEDTLNYKAVAKRIIAYVEQSRFQLIEPLAENIAKILLHEFPLSWLRLRINKQGAVRGARDVGIVIERRPEDFSVQPP